MASEFITRNHKLVRLVVFSDCIVMRELDIGKDNVRVSLYRIKGKCIVSTLEVASRWFLQFLLLSNMKDWYSMEIKQGTKRIFSTARARECVKNGDIFFQDSWTKEGSNKITNFWNWSAKGILAKFTRSRRQKQEKYLQLRCIREWEIFDLK